MNAFVFFLKALIVFYKFIATRSSTKTEDAPYGNVIVDLYELIKDPEKLLPLIIVRILKAMSLCLISEKENNDGGNIFVDTLTEDKNIQVTKYVETLKTEALNM